MKGKGLLLAGLTLLCLLYIIGLVHYAEVRPIDGDEGFYITAARLVSEGKTPYRDFCYHQGPLLPYLYSWIWALHPRSLLAMRFLSAACGGLAVFLWGVCLLSTRRLPKIVALVTFAVVLLNPYWVSWNVIVETHAVANLLMSIATICLYAALHSDRARWYFTGGLALGACASVRLLYAPLVPAVVLWLFWLEWRTSKPPYPKTLTLLSGAAGGLSPIITSFLSDPRALIFDNVQMHTLQTGYRWVGGKAVIGYESVGHVSRVYFNYLFNSLLADHPYFSLEVLLSLVGGWSLLKLCKKQQAQYTDGDYRYFQLAFLMLAVYTATALIPFPPFDQYFTSPLVPFLLPFVAEGLRFILLSWGRSVALAVLTVPLLFSGEISRESLKNSGYPWCQLSAYSKVAEAIKVNSRPDDIVLSSWPGYVFESGRRYFPGMENHMVFRITSRISQRARTRYHVVSKDEVLSAVSTGAAPTLVVGPWMGEFYANLSTSEVEEFHAAVRANYLPVYETVDVAVFRRRW
jgi:hypothetical protein